MSKDKIKRFEIESEYKESVKKESIPKLDFDLYFQKLMVKNKRIKSHHKTAMKSFIKEITEATEEEFDKLFKKY